MQKQAFRCFVYREGSGYYAECLDLTLLTRRETMQAAMSDLQEIILGYLESVYGQGDEQTLVPRHAPRYRWLEFYKQLVVHTVRALFTGRFDGFLASVDHKLRAPSRSETGGRGSQTPSEHKSVICWAYEVNLGAQRELVYGR